MHNVVFDSATLLCVKLFFANNLKIFSGRIDDKILSNLAHAKTANELMESLKESFKRRSATAALGCFPKLINLKFNENTSMQAHIAKFESLLRELDEFGEPFPHGPASCYSRCCRRQLYLVL